MTEQDLYTIEMYLHGQLTGDEKLEFEQRLKSDPAFKTTFGQVGASIIAIRQSAMDEKLALLRDEEKKQAALENPTFRITPLYRWVAVAAVLLVGLFFLTPLFKTEDTIRNPYLAEHFEAYILHDTYKGTGDMATHQEKVHAYDLYAIKDFKHALPLLAKYWETEHDTLSLFYLWVSAVGSGKTSIEHQYEKIVKEDLSGNSKYEKLLDELTKN